jgi:hypothetical protein
MPAYDSSRDKSLLLAGEDKAVALAAARAAPLVPLMWPEIVLWASAKVGNGARRIPARRYRIVFFMPYDNSYL